MSLAKAPRIATRTAARIAARGIGRGIGPGLRLTAPLALVAGLAGCGQFGSPLEAFGQRIPPPDEFQVQRNAPPQLPPSYTLPEPQLGAPSPLAPDPDRAAVAALLGPEVAARRAATGAPSRGEQALLTAADAASTSGDIRVQLEEDKRQAAADAPYEPPLLWDLIGVTQSDEGEDYDEAEVIDPEVEAERLRQAGVAAPVDPDAAARRRAEEAAEDTEPPEPIDRVPQNRIGPPPTPAF